MIICKICKQEFKNITNTHLVKHDLTINEYLKQFPKDRIEMRKVLASRKGIAPWNKGLTKETDERVRKTGENNKRLLTSGKLSIGHKEKIRQGEIRAYKNGTRKRGTKTEFQRRVKNLVEYKIWRKEVFERDSYICRDCNKQGGILHPHHIKRMSDIIRENKITTLAEAISCKELWDIQNGLTLCKKCHYKTDNYGSKGNRKIKTQKKVEKTLSTKN